MSKMILIIEDEESIQNIIKAFLKVQTRELDSGETTTYRCHQRARRIDAEPMNL